MLLLCMGLVFPRVRRGVRKERFNGGTLRGRHRESGSVRRGIGTQHASIHIFIATDPNGLLKGEGVLGGELATEDL